MKKTVAVITMIFAFVGITFSQTIARSGFVKKIDTNQYK